MDMSKYLGIFIDESRENLLSLNQSLLILENETENTNEVDAVFRVAHTLKGMSATMGYSKMTELTHGMEDVLHAVKNGKVTLDPAAVDLLFKCLDILEDYLDSIVETGDEGEREALDILQKLKKIESGSKDKDLKITGLRDDEKHQKKDMQEQYGKIKLSITDNKAINSAIESGLNVFRLTVILTESCVLKAARSYVVFKALRKYGDILKSYPPIEDIEDKIFGNEFTVIIKTEKERKFLIKELIYLSGVEDVLVDELHVSKIKKDIEKKSGLRQKSKKINKSVLTKTVRVDIEKLDVVLNLISELIIQKTRLNSMKSVKEDREYIETLEYLERIINDLHDGIMKTRMVPIESVFDRFPRMLRDISKEQGKKIEFDMSGEETELDRSVIDEIGDPLIHLLRNSVDHGIEPADERIAKGKSETGHIHLKAYQDGSNVIIEVGDDGRGIDVDKVRDIIMERGLVTSEKAESMTEKEIITYLFSQNFSTAENVTDLSGRGVGLDVVRTKIESLGGYVEVNNKHGIGCSFLIRIPLTLAIVQALLIEVKNETYAIELTSVNRILFIEKEEIRIVQNQEVFMLNEMMVPIIRLDRTLDIEDYNISEREKKRLTVVLVKKGNDIAGLAADKIIGQQDIVQKALGRYFEKVRVISSATILGDGSVALVLDINSIIKT